MQQRADAVDETRGEDGHEVACKHRLILTQALQGHVAIHHRGHHEPCGDSQPHATPGRRHGTSSIGLTPHEHVPERHHRRADEDAHEQVDEVQVQAELVQPHSQHAHATAEANDHGLGDDENLLAAGFRIDVGLVDVVDDQGRDREPLGRARRSDGVEEHDGHHHGARLAEEVRGNGWRHQPRPSLSSRQRQLQRNGTEPKGGGQREGDGKPGHATQEVALVRACRPRRNGRLPVSVVTEDRPEVADDVDDAEHRAARRQHGDIGALLVAGDGPARVLPRLVEGVAILVCEEPCALRLRVARHRLQALVDLCRGGLHDVHSVDADNQDHEDHCNVDVVCDELRLQSSHRTVEDHTPRDEEGRNVDVHARERVDCGRAAQQQHRRDNHVRQQAEEQEGQVRLPPPTRADHLADSVRRRCLAFDLNGQHAKEQHLDRGARRIPVGTRDAVGPGLVGGLQQCRCPRPLGHDHRGHESSLRAPARSVELL
mmetsp:Transcript_33576/g.85924  ORF Transcript_33576/g.85924 Transcript_33576/m.85924 type:complete len:486 (-) Transcript_33576:225-1682(-)